MRVLLIHAREFWFQAIKKALREAAEEVPEKAREGRATNALVVFTAVEDRDAEAADAVVEKAADDIAKVVESVGAKQVVVYPYAHLSPRLAPPHKALEVLKKLEEVLRSRGLDVLRAPFGWYKEFRIHCYGHPLSELSREYVAEEKRRPAVRVEKEYLVLTPEGEIYDPREYLKRADEDFRRLIEKEALGVELGEVESPVAAICEKFGFEWEPMSDYGHMRYEPHATLMVEAVSEYSWYVARSLGIPVLKVRGTNMFDLSVKPVAEHAALFGDRLYELQADKKRLVLRYAACHQQFAMLKDYVMSYRDLPLGMFELADSYRFEQSGEVTLCFRLRKFLMPDLHILTKDLDEALKIAAILQRKIHEEASKLGQRYVAVYNVTRDYWEEHRDHLVQLIRNDGRPALIALYPAGIYYWVVNVEYHIVDVAGRPREIATFQFDVGNAKRFGIKYVDENNVERYPVIIHTAIIGSVERYLYMVFDSAAKMMKQGRTPYLPAWLSPIQVRLIPVEPRKHLRFAEEVADTLESRGIRVDIDDRDLGLGKRVRDAAREWIPYIGVIGGREVETGTVNVTVRRTNDRVVLSPEELARMVEDEIRGYPKVSPTLPRYVSKRPTLAYLDKSIRV